MAHFQTKFQILFLLLGVLLIVVLSYGFQRANQLKTLEQIEPNALSQFKGYKIYKQGKSLTGVQILGPDGNLFDLGNVGEHMILNVWATWCTPCVKELPALATLNKALSEQAGWRVIAVSIDSKQNLNKVSSFVTKFNVEGIANYHDFNAELQKTLNVGVLPTTYIVNRSGVILYEIKGYSTWNTPELFEFLKLVQGVK